MEVSNDQEIMETQDAFNRIGYAELILKIARLSESLSLSPNTTVLDFVGKSTSDLNTRIHFILADSQTYTPDNAYFLKSDDTLKLYVGNEYIASFDTVPDTLEEIPIYDEENFE